MLSKDFEETYFRVENNIIDNPESMYIDREGRVIFTHPFLTESVLRGDKLVIPGAKNHPENVNMIIDNISILSTNPSIKNYLPLKLEVGEKQQVEFPAYTFEVLNKYKIIVDPPVNNNQIRNRRYSPDDGFSYQVKPPLTFTFDYVQQLLETDTHVYVVANTLSPSSIQIFGYEKATDTWAIKVDSIGIERSKSNEVQAVYERANQIYDIETNALIHPAIPDLIQDYKLTGNTLIALTALLDVHTLWIYQKVGTGYNLALRINGWFEGIQVNSAIGTFGNFGQDIFFITYLDPNVPLTPKRYLKIQTSTFDKVDDFSKSPNTTVEIGVNPDYVYLSGPNLKEPLITMAEQDDILLNIWVFYQWDWSKVISGQPLSASNANASIEVKVSGPGSFFPKRFQNQVYFVEDSGDLWVLNLDTFKVIRYCPDELVPSGLYSRRNQSVNLSNSNLLFGGLSWTTQPTNVSFSIAQLSNKRVVDDVYALNFAFDQREFSYNLSDNRFNLTIRLPNNTPMADAEIFKYVIDLRLRYSKAKQVVNPLTFKRPKQETIDTDVEKVLGLVDKDFSVVDFLKLYR